jgi:hypothetical protein
MFQPGLSLAIPGLGAQSVDNPAWLKRQARRRWICKTVEELRDLFETDVSNSYFRT